MLPCIYNRVGLNWHNVRSGCQVFGRCIERASDLKSRSRAMALLPYIDESKASEKTKEILGNTPRKLNVARMIANASDAAFQNWSRLGNSLMTKGKLNSRLREIAILHTARVSGALYEYTHHVPIAKSVGVSNEQLKAVDNWEKASCFDDLDKLVLRFTDEIAGGVSGSGLFPVSVISIWRTSSADRSQGNEPDRALPTPR